MPSFSFKNFLKAHIRRKHIDPAVLKETKLNRCLSTLDLTFLGIGSTLGLGIYVLAGQVASTKAGPSVTLSFLVAAIASIFAGLCYAEFGARVPRAGSAYVYSYVTVGEYMAFIIGWNLILEYVIGTASVARGYSGYIDSLFNGTIEHHLKDWMPLKTPGISAYPDFLAFGITVFLTLMLVIGVKESTRFNNVFTCLNLLVVLFAVICGSFKADIHNWQLNSTDIPANCTVGDDLNKVDCGKGGFFAYGFSGMMAGAATCFYGFVGFDVIATTGEEVRNPQRAIPISVVVSLLFIFVAYFSVSAVETLMWPYFDQYNSAPLPYVFEMVGWPVARWIIAIGALAGLSTSLLGAMFPLPRILYAMSTDGLIFRFLSDIHPRYKTPVLSTVLSGLFAGFMAMMFDVHELADMMSIGTLLAYTLVAVSVLILRYSHEQDVVPLKSPIGKMASIDSSMDKGIYSADDSASFASSSTNVLNGSSCANGSTTAILDATPQRSVARQLFNLDNLEAPNKMTSSIGKALVIVIASFLIILDVLLIIYEEELFTEFKIAPLTCVGFVILIIVLLMISLGRQPSNVQNLSFKVPWVPLIPILSMFVNIYLMLKLTWLTWVRFAVWMFIGLSIYYIYGIWYSSESAQTPPPPQPPSKLANSLQSPSSPTAGKINNFLSPNTIDTTKL